MIGRLMVGLSVGAALAGAFGVGMVLADEGDDLPDPVLRSYDAGTNLPRVIGWCFGSDAIYQAKESDGLAVAVDSPNCDEGGLLEGEA